MKSKEEYVTLSRDNEWDDYEKYLIEKYPDFFVEDIARIKKESKDEKED